MLELLKLELLTLDIELLLLLLLLMLLMLLLLLIILELLLLELLLLLMLELLMLDMLEDIDDDDWLLDELNSYPSTSSTIPSLATEKNDAVIDAPSTLLVLVLYGNVVI
jgi:hypothetical protein